MKPLSIWMISSVALAGLVAGSLLQSILISAGRNPILITPWLSLLFALVSVFLLVVGVGVRKLKRKTHTWVTPVMAGRTALFSRSSAPICSASTGFLFGIAIVGFARAWAPAVFHSAWSALLAGGFALLATICAVVVERWCVDDSSGEDERDSARRSSRGSGRPSDAASARQSHI